MLVSEALSYLEMGWGVYPAHKMDEATGKCSCGNLQCPCPGKHPIGRWLNYQHKLPSKEEVVSWFTSMDCNIGTITGSVSNLVVVDVDGEKGIQTLKTLNLAPTLTSRTGGNGYHLFYFSPVSIPTRKLPGIDLKSEGGYVVLPPSIHNSGRQYKWLRNNHMAMFDPEPFKPYTNFYTDFSNNGNHWYVELLEGVSEGERSVTASKLVGRYFRLGLDEEEIWIFITDWNSRNSPPLPENELRRTFDFIKRKHEEITVPQQIETFRDIEILLKGGKLNNN